MVLQQKLNVDENRMKTKRGEHKKNILKLMTTIIEYF
jgi:hypothetical protein